MATPVSSVIQVYGLLFLELILLFGVVVLASVLTWVAGFLPQPYPTIYTEHSEAFFWVLLGTELVTFVLVARRKFQEEGLI